MRPHDAPSACAAKGVVRATAAWIGAVALIASGWPTTTALADDAATAANAAIATGAQPSAPTAGVPDPATSAAERRAEVRIEATNSYWTQLPSGMTALPEHIPFAKRGLFVITGTLRNSSSTPMHHVLLAYDLVDTAGKVVFHEEGYNRAAESLIELDEGVIVENGDVPAGAAPLPAATAPPAVAPAIQEIAPGGTDTFRMIIPGEELPAFDHPNVSVVSAR